jgi:hypothetical protein
VTSGQWRRLAAWAGGAFADRWHEVALGVEHLVALFLGRHAIQVEVNALALGALAMALDGGASWRVSGCVGWGATDGSSLDWLHASGLRVTSSRDGGCVSIISGGRARAQA